MKRFSIFCAALFAAVTSFAAVSYELNGGVTNDDNWLSKGDMWTAFCADAGVTTLGTLEEVKATADELAKKYEDRIYSRIVGAGSRILVFEGKDRRIFG